MEYVYCLTCAINLCVVPDAPFITMKKTSGSDSVGRRPPETQRCSDVGVLCRSCRNQEPKPKNKKTNAKQKKKEDFWEGDKSNPDLS